MNGNHEYNNVIPIHNTKDHREEELLYQYSDNPYFNLYFNYMNIDVNTEVPVTCHRWCALSVLAVLLGRRITLPFGNTQILPNLYIQMIGDPATRKSTAINLAKGVLKKYSFDNFAPKRTSLEKYLLDLHELTWGKEVEGKGSAADDDFLFEELAVSKKKQAEDLPVAESFICNDEFVDFIGRSNLDFISTLGTFWDIDEVFDQALKHSKPVYINKPTINILSGNTITGFNKAFPSDIQDQGFFSRLLIIHVEPTGKKVDFPVSSGVEITKELIAYLRAIQNTCVGNFTMDASERELCGKIYRTWEPIQDSRFAHYSGRRYTQMLKLSMLIAASNIRTEITCEDIVLGNTILSFAEYTMPTALGEFGRARSSPVIHKIITMVEKATRPVQMSEIIAEVYMDMDNIAGVGAIVKSLVMAGKIRFEKEGIFPVKKVWLTEDTELVKPSLLTDYERGLK